VVSDSGQPLTQPVTVALFCGIKSLQAVHTDQKGYFNINLGMGGQGNGDFSASEDVAILAADGSMLPVPGVGSVQDDVVTGCEVRVSVSGYRPLTYNMHGSANQDFGRVNVGTLMLSRIGGPAGASVSISSMLVPDSARKEFEKGEKDAQNNKDLKSATQHLEKAVTLYDKYAVAWSELGRIYAVTNEVGKAGSAYEKAIAADPAYAPAYTSLANLDLQTGKNEEAVAHAAKALEIDPNNTFAFLIDAMGNFNLNRMDDAEKSARKVEQAPHGNVPQVHALLANVDLRKHDVTGAAAEMRAYLKESPQGEFAEQMKSNLEELEKQLGGSQAAAETAP
jgi:hypothetical protein